MNKPYFIAEISANHVGSFKVAKKLIRIAKKYGADAVKLQTYNADSMTINSNEKNFLVSGGLWKGKKLWSLYDQAKTPYEWHKKLFNYSKKIKITCFSTPFDTDAVNFLEKLNCPFYKISSFEMNDLTLLDRVIKTKKPLIISTGTSSLEEITFVMNFLKKKKVKDISLLYCVSNYPADVSDFNLNNIRILKKKFKCKIGFSDHSKNNLIAVAALSCGAEIFEKHIACEESKNSPDFKFSLVGSQIRSYRECLDQTYKMINKRNFYRSKKENLYKNFRRSIYAIKDIKKGDKFSYDNIKTLRPFIGLEPKYFYQLLGKKSPINISKNKPIKKNMIEILKKNFI